MRKTQINMIRSFGYLMISIFMLSVVTYAWFTITDENHAYLTTKTSGIEAEYEFYAYKNKYHYGSNNQTLINNKCEVGVLEDLCYEEVKNPLNPKLIEGSVAPGERFSFAIGIKSLGSMQGYVDLTLGNLESIGYDFDINKIQTAFGYEVTKISYIDNDVETTDKKSEMTYQSFTHFSSDEGIFYPVVVDVPLVHNDLYSAMLVVYFDIYYDPSIFGFDELLISYTNSHIFMNQTFHIHDVYMNVSSQKRSS